MEIHFLKEDALAALKANVQGNIKNYSQPTNEWICEYFGGENPFVPYKIQIDDFQFLTGKDSDMDLGYLDVENTIRLYDAMKGLSDTQATDERLWAGLCHGDFWSYMQERWNGGKSSGDPVAAVQTRYFFKNNNGIRRSLFINTLSKLWWIGRLTYDPTRKDPYELTKYLRDDYSTKSLVLFSSNYTNSRNVVVGLLSALIELEQAGFTYGKKKREVYYQATKYLNIFGGTHILDYYSSDEIKEKVLSYMWGLVGATPPIVEKRPTDSTDEVQDNQASRNGTDVEEVILTTAQQDVDVEQKQNNEIPELSSDDYEEQQETENQDIFTLLEKNKVSYIDKRGNNGVLWLVGGLELKPLVVEARKLGFYFRFKEEGGKATKGKPSWWAK